MSKKIAVLLAVVATSFSALATEEFPDPAPTVPDSASTMVLLVPALGALAIVASRKK